MYRSEERRGEGGEGGPGGRGAGTESGFTTVICEFDSVKRSSDTEIILEKSVKFDLVNDEQLL